MTRYGNMAGFSLIGLALLLFLIGIGISTLTLLTPNLETSSREKTVSALKADKKALTGFAASKGRLPPFGTFTFENVIPSFHDGYQNLVRYSYDSRLTSADGICNNKTTWIQVDGLANVALVIWSQGRNGAVTAGKNRTEGAIGASLVMSTPAADVADDDLLEWVTLEELQKAAGCGELGSTLEIVTAGVPYGTVPNIYGTASFKARGGSGSGYLWCVESDAIASGVLQGKLQFDVGSLTVGASGTCVLPAYSNGTPGDTLTLSGAAPLQFSDGHQAGIQYPLRIVLQDGTGNRANRAFLLVVNDATHTINLVQNYSKEYLQALGSLPGTGEDLDHAGSGLGNAWSEINRFTNNQNGTVTDNLTGLVWLKKANCGQFYTLDLPASSTKTWSAAVTASNSLASGKCGLTDGSAAGAWRLPNVRELATLVDFGRSAPSLPTGHPFDGIPSGAGPHYYWTSTSAAADAVNKAWAVDLASGLITAAANGNAYHLLAVKGGQFNWVASPTPKSGQTVLQQGGDDGDLEKGVAWPTPRFEASNGTVTDKLTGLIWMKNAGCWTAMDWTASLGMVSNFNNLTLPWQTTCGVASAQTDWRMPNIRELSSLIHYGLAGPAIQSGVFDNVKSGTDYYWSSTSVTNPGGNAWFLSPDDGTISWNAQSSSSGYYLLLVRGGK
ncbi:MAG: DUF1566 domain-containing protein [Magnetococcus sp. YQC-5]